MKEKTTPPTHAKIILRRIRGYLISCFLLTIPVLIWDLALSKELPPIYQPETFWKDIPTAIVYGEHISRTLLFACLILMPLRIQTPMQQQGLRIYILGIILYYSSWLLLICFPGSTWSESMAGFMAPAYTPLCWLIGITLIGHRFYFPFAYSRLLFIGIAVLFLLFHNLHTFLVYAGSIVNGSILSD